MQTSPIVVFCYLIFQSFLLSRYDYKILSYHSLYIAFIHLYLSIRKQSSAYHVLKQIAQKRLQQQQQQKQQLKQCLICKRIKPSRYYHCRRCNVCIYRMDHHCQWIGNCMGQFNFKPFVHYVFNLFGHNLILFVNIFVCNLMDVLTNTGRSVYLLLILIPILFALYETQRLIRDFYHMIKENQTLIESYKLVKGKQSAFQQGLNEFLGSNNILFWFIPIYLPFQSPQKSSNLLEITNKVQQTLEQPQQLTFADEYMYGKDDQNEDELIKQAKYD